MGPLRGFPTSAACENTRTTNAVSQSEPSEPERLLQTPRTLRWSACTGVRAGNPWRCCPLARCFNSMCEPAGCVEVRDGSNVWRHGDHVLLAAPIWNLNQPVQTVHRRTHEVPYHGKRRPHAALHHPCGGEQR